MFVGHFGIGFLGKRISPQPSLGTMLAASVLFDLLWIVFLFAGIERLSFKQAPFPPTSFNTAIDYLDFSFDYSHSLLIGTLWSALFAGVYFLCRRHARAAWVLFAVALSHWLLDFISHRPDMPIAPGVNRYFGLGLWTSTPATVAVEGSLWLTSVIVYAHATNAKSRLGVFAFWTMIVLITLLWIVSPFDTQIPTVEDLNQTKTLSLVVMAFLLIWAYWINRLRPVK